MSKLAIYDMSGKPQGEMEVADDLLVLDRGDQSLHDAVVAHQAALRAGTASTLSKGQVSGSNKKPWRQKGTGRARAGYRQSPVWRGGAVAFGPHPRSYRKKITKKTRRLAFCRALSERISEGAVKLLEGLELSAAKTKEFTTILKSLEISRGAIVVLGKPDRDVLLAARNVPNVEVVIAGDMNAYQVLKYPVIVVAGKEAMEKLKDRLAGPGERKVS